MLGRIALRMAAVAALKGRTLVGDNVLDSEMGALDVAADNTLRTDQDKPFISIYVEGAKLESGFDIRGMHKPGATELIIEIGTTTAMTVTDEDTGASEVVGLEIPATDSAFEFFLDYTGRQVLNALTDPANEWAEIWRGLTSRIIKIERRRTSDATQGARIAAHQMIMTVDLLPDPVYGESVADTSIWKKFFDKLASSTDGATLKKHAALLALLGDPDSTTTSVAQQRRFGMTLDEVRALFGTPVVDGADEVPIADVSLQIRP